MRSAGRLPGSWSSTSDSVRGHPVPTSRRAGGPLPGLTSQGPPGYGPDVPSDANPPSDRPAEPAPEPTPRLRTPADESPEMSVQREQEAVGDAPDVGGLTPADDAQ
jgi:hypothetical protein